MSGPGNFDTTVVKRVEQLLDEGGKFYEVGGEAWCDTALDSWKLFPELGGYVRAVDQGEGGDDE